MASFADLDDFLKQYGPDVSVESYADYQTLLTWFDGIGALVKNQYIDIKLVTDLLSGRGIWYWELVENLVHESRLRYHDPLMFENFEYLYNELKKTQT